MSWNGDTETVAWRFFAGTDGYGSREFLGEVDRTSFETSLFVRDKQISSISAVAIDALGSVLTSTADVAVEAEILPSRKSKGSLPGDKAGAERTQKPLGSTWHIDI